jgi:hypothetical protein
VMMDVIFHTMELHQMWWWMWSFRSWSCTKYDDDCVCVGMRHDGAIGYFTKHYFILRILL